MLFPPMPAWGGMHPLLVHFPIALLLVAPIFLALGIVRRERGAHWLRAALLLSAFGMAGAWVAVESGEAAARLADRTPEITAAIERHSSLAELTRNLSTVATLLLAAVLFGPGLLKRKATPRITTIALIVVLGLFGVGALAVAHTGDEGGRLVHDLGVKSLVAPAKGRSIFLGRDRGGDSGENAKPGEGDGHE
jgi:uncharacterized membrane protein